MKRISIVLLSILAFVCLFVACKNEPEPVHEHEFAVGWATDEDSHWHKAKCGHDIVEDKAAHEFDAGVETVHPSETQDGMIVYTCTICGYKKDEVLPAGHYHKYTDWTPSSDGSYHWRATTCETHEVLREEAPHYPNFDTITELEQLSEEGDTQFETTCVNCGYTLKSYDHRFREEWASDDNFHWHEALCNHKDKVEYEAHTFEEKETKKNPTESEEGVIVLECSVCKKTVEAVGHDFDENQQCRICRGYKCGDDVVAVFDEATNTMTFKGKGFVYDFETNYNSKDKDGMKNSINLWGKEIHDKIYHAVFEDGVAGTGEYILSFAKGLKSVRFGANVVEITPHSFYECTNLSSLDFGSSQIKNIGRYAFYGTGISSIALPSSLETIGPGCFQRSMLSGEVKLPEGLKFMDWDVFYGTRIEVLSIPSTLSPKLDSGSGSSCLGNVGTLKRFEVAEGNPYMKASDDGKALVSLDGTTLIAVAAGASDYAIPSDSDIEVVGLYSFIGWKGTSIVVPEGVTKIEEYAFRGCSNLESVELPSSLTSISDSAFYDCGRLRTIKIHKPEGSLEGYENYWMKDPDVPEGIEIIWNYT